MNYIKISLALILTISFEINGQETDSSNQSQSKIYYQLIIDVNHLNRDHEFNHKYIINDCIEVLQFKKEFEIDCREFHKIKYIYAPQFTPEDEFDPYRRVPLDTISKELTNIQLFDIYHLAKKFFTIDSDLDICKIPEIQEMHYDGPWVKITLRIDGIESTFTNTFGFGTKNPYIKPFENLNNYLENIENAP